MAVLLFLSHFSLVLDNNFAQSLCIFEKSPQKYGEATIFLLSNEKRGFGKKRIYSNN